MKHNRPFSIFLILAGLVIFWFGYGSDRIEKWRFYSFEQKRWATTASNDRWFMAKYLVDEELLIGKTESEVLDLLGSAENRGGPMMFYNLGAERSSFVAIDDDWLELMFGGSDRSSAVVVTARIRPD